MPVVDVMRQCERRGGVDVRCVDVDGLQCALPVASRVLNFPRHRPPSSKLRT